MPAPATISVVIPCFNQGEYLEEAIDSVLAQTFGDFEIVVVDDGSTDPTTRELLKPLERPKTRVLTSENRGLPGARNLGIRATSGPYVCALDADDLLEASYFERAVAVLDSRSEIAFVSHWLETFGDESWTWAPERCDLAALLDMNTINGAALVRREALEAVDLFDESLRKGCEDWDLWISLVEAGFRGYILPEVLFHYRRHAAAMSHEMNRAGNRETLYGQLVSKHADSYSRHLATLWQRREVNLCDLRREIFDLHQERTEWWQPELERRRAEVTRIRARLETLEHSRKVQAEIDSLRHEHSALEASRQSLELELEEHLREQVRLQQENEHLLGESRALEQGLEALRDDRSGLLSSRSWRWTRPLRRLIGLLGGPQEPKYDD